MKTQINEFQWICPACECLHKLSTTSYFKFPRVVDCSCGYSGKIKGCKKDVRIIKTIDYMGVFS